MKLLRHVSGVVGLFKKEVFGIYGKTTIIVTAEGREFFAPTNEFLTQ